VLLAARDLIASERAERVVAAGFDELSLYACAGLAALRATSRVGVRPFDRRRDGTLFSEGAGALVVEEEAAARERGAEPLAELAGGALGNDGYHMTAPQKEARGIIALIRSALADAGVAPDDIDHVNLHGTGTRYNDLIETKALKAVVGERARALREPQAAGTEPVEGAGALPVTANKGAMGHAMGAAGALETVAAVLSIREGLIPPTAGLEEQDAECDLSVVRERAHRAPVSNVLKLSYGIGGANAAVVVRRPSR
jgi:3-oxoacyl-[acyl-carrier-protein] synthase II